MTVERESSGAAIWHGAASSLFQPAQASQHRPQRTLPYSASLPSSEEGGAGAVALAGGEAAGAVAPLSPPSLPLVQRPQVAAQKPPSAIHASPHLPQPACCWQVKPSGVGRSAQAAPSVAGAARKRRAAGAGAARKRRAAGAAAVSGGSRSALPCASLHTLSAMRRLGKLR